MAAISAQVLTSLVAQYWHESANAFKYDVAASAMEYRGLTGTAKWLRGQADGERSHAAKVRGYIEDRNEALAIGALDLSSPSSDGLFEVLSFVQEVELATTAKLEALALVAEGAGDRMTCQWLMDPSGLIKEQVSEENEIQTILDRYNVRAMAGDYIGAIEHDMDDYIGSLA